MLSSMAIAVVALAVEKQVVDEHSQMMELQLLKEKNTY